jgi:prefoldin subunit 5
MDTDQVRMMASALRREADTMDGHMTSIKASVEGANWQSQAREEYVSNLETLLRVNAQTTQAMRLMAQAAEKKAEQWEIIANKFNGPFEQIGDVWRNFLDHLNNTWQGIISSIKRTRLPNLSLVPLAANSAVGFVTLGALIRENKIPSSWVRPGLNTQTLGVTLDRSGGTYNPALSVEDLSNMGEYELFDEIKGMKIRQNDISLQIPKLENKISEIDAQIADCEEKLRNAEQEEARLFNKIFNQDEKYEQVADNYRKQIEDLNGMKKRYQSEIESLNAEATNINTKLPVADQLITEKLAIFNGNTPARGTDVTHWRQANIPFHNDSSHRDPRFYDAAINQFAVNNNSRYMKDDYTYCNVFAGDVARSMGVPFPTKGEWYNKNDPMTIGFPELREYFNGDNPSVSAVNDGWREVSSSNLEALEAHVNSGKMGIVISQGHVAVVKPNQDITDLNSIQIAQAGAMNTNSTTVGKGFGSEIHSAKIFIVD